MSDKTLPFSSFMLRCLEQIFTQLFNNSKSMCWVVNLSLVNTVQQVTPKKWLFYRHWLV